MYNDLNYRRQFLISKEIVEELDHWQYRRFNDTHLYVHPDLEITGNRKSPIEITLVGYMFDPFQPGRTNEEIVTGIISNINNFEELLVSIKPFPGRYVLIYKDSDEFNIFHDPLGLREIYYCEIPNKVICGSQPNLLSKYSIPELEFTRDPKVRNFYNDEMKPVRNGRLWVGDETYFQNVRHLTPNHYLDLELLTSRRYWPRKRLEKEPLESAVEKSCNYLKGVMEAVTARHDVMMAVTSGFDSRSLLAASKDISDRIYFFVNMEPPLNRKSPDISVPTAIFEKIKIPFHVHEIEDSMDEEFRKIFLDNVFMSTDRILTTIYNVYYREHPEKMNLLGVGELGREYYGNAPPKLDGYFLARTLKYKDSVYVTEQCQKWLEEARGTAERYNVDIMRLFLWEGLLSNWGVLGNSESDIAIEEFDPYDCHYIYEILMSLDPKECDLFGGMFNKMWPELLEFPFNPPESIRERTKYWLRRAGIFQILQRMIYRVDRWKFEKKMKRS